MLLERLIIKKNREINILKKQLVNRDMDRNKLIENIRYVMDDLELLVDELSFIIKRSKSFTINEVAKYNGVGDNLAYIVINGTVYDVTGVKELEKCNFKFGSDVTKEFNECFKGDKDILKNLRVVGVLKE